MCVCRPSCRENTTPLITRKGRRDFVAIVKAMSRQVRKMMMDDRDETDGQRD